MNQYTSSQTEFVNLLTSHQRRLFGYIATFLPNPADIEEVLQQTNMILWSKAEEFTPGTSFRAWSFRVAHLRVMAFRRRNLRERQLFSNQLIETMSAELESFDSEPTVRALQKCLAQLASEDRELVVRCYTAGATVKQVAAVLSRPAKSIYRSLGRIRYLLLECIQQTLAVEEHS